MLAMRLTCQLKAHVRGDGVRTLTTGFALACAVVSVSCVSGDVGPINELVSTVGRDSEEFIPEASDDGSTVVGLAFSGGGTRTAAFSYGVLRELDEIVIDTQPERRTLLDDIRMISGASGGAVTATYFGYKGKDGYHDLRERFLVKDAEAYLRKRFSPINLARAYNGGVNDRRGFPRWLDENLFDGATFASLDRSDAPVVWINASDIFNRTPFLFTYDTFAALCSDLDKVRLSDAVAASAAVPVAFSPLVVSAAEPNCNYTRPKWLANALEAPEASMRLRSYARALEGYQKTDDLDYVKLLDGGLTDNIGVTGFTIERLSAQTPYGPLSPAGAVKLRKFIFVVADAGQSTTPDWGETVGGPKVATLLNAVTGTTISALVRNEFDALKLAMDNWKGELVRYRCGLSLGEVRKLRGSLAGWNCRDVELVIELVSFHDVDANMRARLNYVPTRLKLPVAEVDLTIEAGRLALRNNRNLAKAVAEIQRYAGVSGQLAAAD
ncbi:patatin-like phospholipase family protein [Mesorhizobium sp. ANAO-SY3R2]|uniref:patatin-like phospholipase family protein n=1 Tax=Mesorhizobium sp. ANAO-SY3R2 TaxID=3166644 RepID=UPI00366AC313